MTLNCAAIKDTRERPRKEKNMFYQKINLQLFGEDDFSDIAGADLSESLEDTAESTESVAETTAEDNAENSGENDAPQQQEPFRVFQTQEEYQSYFDNIIGKRLRGTREKTERLDKLEPMLNVLQQRYGVSDESELIDLVQKEMIPQIAYNEGITEDQYRKRMESERQMQDMQRQIRDFQHQQFISALTNDVSKMAGQNPELYGNIDASELSENQQFLALLSQGFDVKKAYDALHLDEITQKLAQQTSKQVVDNIIAKGTRPAESAAVSVGAANTSNNVASMSDDEIEALAARAMRGERIEL